MTGHLHLVPKLKMCGTKFTRPIYTSVAFIGITKPQLRCDTGKRSSDTPGEERIFLLPTDIQTIHFSKYFRSNKYLSNIILKIHNNFRFSVYLARIHFYRMENYFFPFLFESSNKRKKHIYPF